MAGFEPAASCSQSRRANQAAPHPVGIPKLIPSAPPPACVVPPPRLPRPPRRLAAAATSAVHAKSGAEARAITAETRSPADGVRGGPPVSLIRQITHLLSWPLRWPADAVARAGANDNCDSLLLNEQHRRSIVVVDHGPPAASVTP
jgi:hypothetical protein